MNGGGNKNGEEEKSYLYSPLIPAHEKKKKREKGMGAEAPLEKGGNTLNISSFYLLEGGGRRRGRPLEGETRHLASQ